MSNTRFADYIESALKAATLTNVRSSWKSVERYLDSTFERVTEEALRNGARLF